MTMEESIIKTASLYNKVLGFKQANTTFHRFTGKIMLYEDVMGKPVTFNTDVDGKISAIIFGEDRVEV